VGGGPGRVGASSCTHHSGGEAGTSAGGLVGARRRGAWLRRGTKVGAALVGGAGPPIKGA